MTDPAALTPTKKDFALSPSLRWLSISIPVLLLVMYPFAEDGYHGDDSDGAIAVAIGGVGAILLFVLVNRLRFYMMARRLSPRLSVEWRPEGQLNVSLQLTPTHPELLPLLAIELIEIVRPPYKLNQIPLRHQTFEAKGQLSTPLPAKQTIRFEATFTPPESSLGYALRVYLQRAEQRAAFFYLSLEQTSWRHLLSNQLAPTTGWRADAPLIEANEAAHMTIAAPTDEPYREDQAPNLVVLPPLEFLVEPTRAYEQRTWAPIQQAYAQRARVMIGASCYAICAFWMAFLLIAREANQETLTFGFGASLVAAFFMSFSGLLRLSASFAAVFGACFVVNAFLEYGLRRTAPAAELQEMGLITGGLLLFVALVSAIIYYWRRRRA